MAAEVALLVIDMLNPYDARRRGLLAESVAAIVPTMAELIDEASDADGVTYLRQRQLRGLHRDAR